MSGQIIRVVVEVILAGLGKTEAREVVESGRLPWMAGSDPAIPLAPYRALLQEVLDGFGGAPILQAGLELRHAVHPLLFALLNSDRPEILIQKEERLARFIHSRHRVRIVASEPGRLLLEHTAPGGIRPRPTESLASAGQHVAMLEMIGARRLTLRFPRSARPEADAYRDGAVRTVSGADGFALWDFRWDEFVATRSPMAGLDELLLDQARLAEVEERPGIAAAVERILREDLGRRWTLEEIAGRLFMSGRTLQRKLRAVELTFTELAMRVRVAEAMRLLRNSDLNVTAVGYVCGFADSAHFGHSFKRVAGETPGRWRERGGAVSA
jgi:AraC-like DNA-binding protein